MLTGILLSLFVGFQLIPVSRENPPVTLEVRWDSPQTRELAKRACFDCHSNETVWPWYAYIAPVSFGISNHVMEGREKLNFSEWDKTNCDFREVEETITEGEMPLWNYLLMHPEANLTATEKEQLLSGLRATFQQDPPRIP
ncbi:MAG: heme-binding domain-containing protein [Anaerolineae bacterium]|nr:heme-binding domain-containing protein [Anaerolineae bacterium]